jgi:hypothetical protein
MTSSPQLAVQALNEVAKLLSKLTEEQLIDLVAGRAIVEFRTPEVTITSRAPRKAAAPKVKPVADLEEMVRDIKAITQEDEVERYLLERDKLISATMMQELAKRIGPPVSAKGTKAQVRKNIAAGTAGLLDRPASVFSGQWSH